MSIQKCYVGLDISTSVIGVAVLEELTNKIVELIPVCLDKDESVWVRSEQAEQVFKEIQKKYWITSIAVEEPLKMFQSGKSSAQTLITLANFNGIISHAAKVAFGMTPKLINVNTARKTLSIKIDKKDKTKSTKEKVFEQVSSRVSYNWPTKILKSGPNKGKQVMEDFAYDICDAYVVARASKSLP